MWHRIFTMEFIKYIAMQIFYLKTFDCVELYFCLLATINTEIFYHIFCFGIRKNVVYVFFKSLSVFGQWYLFS